MSHGWRLGLRGSIGGGHHLKLERAEIASGPLRAVDAPLVGGGGIPGSAYAGRADVQGRAIGG
jgi:hypothetical protein